MTTADLRERWKDIMTSSASSARIIQLETLALDAIAYAAGLEAAQGAHGVEHDMPRVLDAPCFWCGYNGELYWQAGSHAESCPWRNVGGVVDRTAIIARHYRTLRTEA